MTPFIIATYGLLSIIAAGFALYRAPRRNRNGQAWAFWGFLFPPLAVLLLVLPRNTLPRQSVRIGSDDDDDDHHVVVGTTGL